MDETELKARLFVLDQIATTCLFLVTQHIAREANGVEGARNFLEALHKQISDAMADEPPDVAKAAEAIRDRKIMTLLTNLEASMKPASSH